MALFGRDPSINELMPTGPGEPFVPGPGGAPESPVGAFDPRQLLEELLSKMEMAKAPAPEPQSFRKKFFGSLADALMAASQARIGAPARPGAYQERMAAEQERQRQMEGAANQYNVNTRNQARLTFAEEMLRAQREKDVAAMRGSFAEKIAQARAQGHPLKYLQVQTDEGGVVRNKTHVIDPITNEYLGEYDFGEKGYAPYIQAPIPGVSGPQRFPRQGPSGDMGGTIPPPPPATANTATTATNMRVLYKDALSSYKEYIKTAGPAQRRMTSAGRRLPLIGGAVEEFGLSYTDPAGVDVARKIDNLADILLRLRSGAQINDKEYMRLRSLLPKLGENPVTALKNFERFDTELLTNLRIAYKRAPELFTEDVLRDNGLTMDDLTGPANRGTAGAQPGGRKTAAQLADEMGLK